MLGSPASSSSSAASSLLLADWLAGWQAELLPAPRLALAERCSRFSSLSLVMQSARPLGPPARPRGRRPSARAQLPALHPLGAAPLAALEDGSSAQQPEGSRSARINQLSVQCAACAPASSNSSANDRLSACASQLLAARVGPRAQRCAASALDGGGSRTHNWHYIGRWRRMGALSSWPPLPVCV